MFIYQYFAVLSTVGFEIRRIVRYEISFKIIFVSFADIKYGVKTL